MENVNILTSFAFGLLSFISPCVLPIVPGYLSFISGVSFDEMQNSGNRTRVRNRIVANSLFFILGFSVVFIALGASATVVGRFLHEQIGIISKIAGVVIIIFGLHMIGVLEGKQLGFFGAFLVGLAFAFGWTPCIGPILAAILALASQQDSVGKGMVLLTSYSLGLGVPFLLTGMSLTAFYSAFNRFKKHLHTVEVVGGIMLVAVGALIMTNYLTILSGYLSRWFPFLNDLG